MWTEVKVAGNVFEVAVTAEIDKVIGTTFVYRSLEASEVGPLTRHKRPAAAKASRPGLDCQPMLTGR